MRDVDVENDYKEWLESLQKRAKAIGCELNKSLQMIGPPGVYHTFKDIEEVDYRFRLFEHIAAQSAARARAEEQKLQHAKVIADAEKGNQIDAIVRIFYQMTSGQPVETQIAAVRAALKALSLPPHEDKQWHILINRIDPKVPIGEAESVTFEGRA